MCAEMKTQEKLGHYPEGNELQTAGRGEVLPWAVKASLALPLENTNPRPGMGIDSLPQGALPGTSSPVACVVYNDSVPITPAPFRDCSPHARP